VALIGAYESQVHRLERQLADLPLVHMDPVAVIANGAQSMQTGTTQVARNPATHATLR
jgi:hypothetical protein